MASTRFLLANFTSDLLIHRDRHRRIPDPIAALDTGLCVRDELQKDAGKPDQCTCPGCRGPAPPHQTGPASTGAVDLSGRRAPPNLVDSYLVPLFRPPIQWLLTRPIKEMLRKKSLTWANFIRRRRCYPTPLSFARPQRQLGYYQASWAYISLALQRLIPSDRN
jgi:hypothetical protein